MYQERMPFLSTMTKKIETIQRLEPTYIRLEDKQFSHYATSDKWLPRKTEESCEFTRYPVVVQLSSFVPNLNGVQVPLQSEFLHLILFVLESLTQSGINLILIMGHY